MKFKYIIILLIVFLSGCEGKNNRDKYIDNYHIPLDNYWRRVTGYDSIQLWYGGRGKYNERKQKYDVTWDSLIANFCYPNKWQFEKFKGDTVFIHDTVVVYDKPFKIENWYKKPRRKLHHYPDTIFTNSPLYVDTTGGKRTLKLMQ